MSYVMSHALSLGRKRGGLNIQKVSNNQYRSSMFSRVAVTRMLGKDHNKNRKLP